MGSIVDERPLPGFDAPPPPRAKRKRWWLRSTVVLLFLLTLAGVTLFLPSWLHVFDRPITFWNDGRGYTRYVAHDNEWTLRFPESWEAFHIARHPPSHGRHRPSTYGVFISNIKVTEDELSRNGVSAEIVAARVAWDHHGGWASLCDHDTPLPLALANASSFTWKVMDDRGGSLTAFHLPFSIKRVIAYSMRAWIGSAASVEDRKALEQIVGSIRYPKHGMPRGWYVSGCEIEEQHKEVGGKVS